jgi:hypothetical protein
MRSILATTMSSVESAGADATPPCQSRVAGSIATPQIIVWAMTMAVAVTTMRKAFIAFHHNDDES